MAGIEHKINAEDGEEGNTNDSQGGIVDETVLNNSNCRR